MDEPTKHQIRAVNAMFDVEGWTVLLQQFAYVREKILSDGKKAMKAGRIEKSAYHMARLTGCDDLMNVVHEYERLYKELMTERQEDNGNG